MWHKYVKLVYWFKKLLQIVREYDTVSQANRSRLEQLEVLVKDRTNIAVDHSPFRGGNFVVVVGRYKNCDYVQTFHLRGNDVTEIVEHLRQQERYGNVVKLDSPPVFRAVFERERQG